MYLDGGVLVLLFVVVGFACFQYGKKAGRYGYRKLTDKEWAKRSSDWAESQNQVIYQMHDDKDDKK